MSQPKITLHHLNVSRSERLFWVLEELGLPYDVRVYLRQPTGGAPPELIKLTPFGKAPVVTLGDTNLTESGPIIHKLITSFPSDNVECDPSDSSIFWSHFSEGTMMTIFQASAVINAMHQGFAHGVLPPPHGIKDKEELKGIDAFANFISEGYFKPQSQKHIDEVEKFLTDHSGKFFSGTDKPGEGDFMMFFPTNSLLSGSRVGKFKTGPAIKAWFDMVMARPAAQRAMERLKSEEEQAKSKL